jgi:hypothetical protein
MPIALEVVKAELSFEAAFPQPQFGMLRDGPALLHHLFTRLAPHGLRLNDLRFERGANLSEQHLLCYLFNYWMTIRIRLERVEIVCTELPKDYVEKFAAAILDVLGAVVDYQSALSFQAFAAAVGLHGRLAGCTARDFLARLAPQIPQGLGPAAGNGAVFYFGPVGERVLATITADVSAAISDGLYLRIHGVWDAKKIAPPALPQAIELFVQQALESLELQRGAA